MPVTLGKSCKLYRGTAGTQAATLVDNVRDLTLDLERDEIDASGRDSGDWEEVVSSLKKGTVNFTVKWKKADAGFIAIRDAWIAGTALAFLILDDLKTVPDAQGLDADFTVLKFSIKQELRDIVTVDVSIKPTPSTRTPAWYTVPTP
jgi:hypothetical protein